MSRNRTFHVKGGFFTADEHSVEKIIDLTLPVSCFIPFAKGTTHGGNGIGVNQVRIREYRYDDDDEPEARLEVECKGAALTKAGHVDKRTAGQGYHYAWVDTDADVDRLLAALPDDLTMTCLDGTVIGFTKAQVEAYLRGRVTRIKEQGL